MPVLTTTVTVTENNTVPENGGVTENNGTLQGRSVVNTSEYLDQLRGSIESDIDSFGKRCLKFLVAISEIALGCILIAAGFSGSLTPFGGAAVVVGIVLVYEGFDVLDNTNSNEQNTKLRMLDNDQFIKWANQKNICLRKHNIEENFANFLKA